MRILKKPVIKRKFYDDALLEDMLRQVKYFQERNLDDEELAQIARSVLPLDIPSKQMIFDYSNIFLYSIYILITS